MFKIYTSSWQQSKRNLFLTNVPTHYRYGGHVGWMEGWVPVSGYYWSDRLVASFLQQALSSPGRLTEGQ